MKNIIETENETVIYNSLTEYCFGVIKNLKIKDKNYSETFASVLEGKTLELKIELKALIEKEYNDLISMIESGYFAVNFEKKLLELEAMLVMINIDLCPEDDSERSKLTLS